jgi:hypothetical protein
VAAIRYVRLGCVVAAVLLVAAAPAVALGMAGDPDRHHLTTSPHPTNPDPEHRRKSSAGSQPYLPAITTTNMIITATTRDHERSRLTVGVISLTLPGVPEMPEVFQRVKWTSALCLRYSDVLGS